MSTECTTGRFQSAQVCIHTFFSEQKLWPNTTRWHEKFCQSFCCYSFFSANKDLYVFCAVKSVICDNRMAHALEA